MNAEIDPADLKSTIFDYLSRLEDAKAVKMKEIKLFLQEHFSLPPNSFKEGSLRQMLETFAAQYFAQMDGRSSGSRKMGKFSQSESNTISTALEAYAAEEGIEVRQLCSVFQLDGADDDNRAKSKNNRHKELWDRLQHLLPQRSRKSIIHHATRLIWNMELVDNHFTPEEKQQLLQLVQQHGRRFNIIASKLRKRPDDCRQMLIRLTRQKHGFYSVGEDRELIAAVYELTHRNPDKDPLPTENIPWTGVANKLRNGRIPLDLLRRWRFILKLNQSFGYPYNLTLNDNEEADLDNVAIKLKRKNFDEKNKRRVKLLLLLQDRGYEDATELVWSHVDNLLNFSDGDSSFMWKMMVKQVPDDEELINSMQDQVTYLLEMYLSLLNLTEDELIAFQPPPAEVFQDDLVASNDEPHMTEENHDPNHEPAHEGTKRKKRRKSSS